MLHGYSRERCTIGSISISCLQAIAKQKRRTNESVLVRVTKYSNAELPIIRWFRSAPVRWRSWRCRTRSSATAERQRVSYTRLSRLTHWSCTSLSTASVLQLYNRLAKLVSTLSAKKPCDIRTLSIQGHSRSSLLVPAAIQNGLLS